MHAEVPKYRCFFLGNVIPVVVNIDCELDRIKNHLEDTPLGMSMREALH